MLPLECAQCQPSHLQSNPSVESYTTQVHHEGNPASPQTASRLARADKDFTLPSSFSKTSAPLESKHIEQHPYFRRSEDIKELGKYPYGRAHGETCASCTLTVPQVVAAKLPEGAPGSLPKDGGKSKHGTPVLRSREFVCLGHEKKRHAQEQPSSSQDSQVSSLASISSTGTHADCHDHTLTYLTSKSPDDIDVYAQLRTSVVRALSCEALPRGMSEGPFCFGDASTGYTIAYVFRLTDAKARGRRRTYSFVALAGKDAYRAFKACPMLWDAFGTMAKAIEQAAQQHQDELELQQQKEKEEQLSTSLQKGYTEPSSFLTQRPRDPDGQPRRAGQTQPRSLAEIIGNENIFAILHQYFVAVLRCLGDRFGGLPIVESSSMVYHTTANEQGSVDDNLPARVSSDELADLQIEEDEPLANDAQGKQLNHSNAPASEMDRIATREIPGVYQNLKIPAGSASTASTTPTPTPTQQSQLNSQSQSLSQSQTQSQCAPLGVDVTRQRQVKV